MQKDEDDLDILSLLKRIGSAYAADELKCGELEGFAPHWDVLDVIIEVSNGAILVRLAEHDESVALCGEIALLCEEFLDELWSVRDEKLKLLKNGMHGKDSITSHERMAMLEILTNGGDEGLEDLSVVDLADESEGAAPCILVRMDEFIPDHVTNEDHLWKHLAVWSVLIYDLEVVETELAQMGVLVGEDVADDHHEHARERLAGELHGDGTLEGLCFALQVAGFEMLLELVGIVGGDILVDEQGALPFQGGGHGGGW